MDTRLLPSTHEHFALRLCWCPVALRMHTRGASYGYPLRLPTAQAQPHTKPSRPRTSDLGTKNAADEQAGSGRYSVSTYLLTYLLTKND